MRSKSFFLLLAVILFSSARLPAQGPSSFDVQGHRGCRGLMPENTIPAFLKALEIGVDTLELDVVVSRDRQLVVSHDPFFAADISLDRDGRPIPPEKQTEYNIFRMDYDEIRLFDVGSRGNPRFPDQQKMRVFKPLLADVFRETRKYIEKHGLKPVRFNIETKSTPAGDNLFQPPPDVFAKLLYDEIVRRKMQKLVSIQSFDVRTLQEFNKFKHRLPLVLLVENRDGVEKNIERLGFQPDVYSPNYLLVDQAAVDYCRRRAIKIIPWTVNEPEAMEKLKKLGIDGIISDYPDRAIRVFRGGN
ncbi:MAG: glycerophosphodiester phosphodiesterase [Acidobacteria bacterium]|nr:glycerophosphodiester phosphodiesterase [Acidobacteriota bacterium]